MVEKPLDANGNEDIAKMTTIEKMPCRCEVLDDIDADSSLSCHCPDECSYCASDFESDFEDELPNIDDVEKAIKLKKVKITPKSFSVTKKIRKKIANQIGGAKQSNDSAKTQRQAKNDAIANELVVNWTFLVCLFTISIILTAISVGLLSYNFLKRD